MFMPFFGLAQHLQSTVSTKVTADLQVYVPCKYQFSNHNCDLPSVVTEFHRHVVQVILANHDHLRHGGEKRNPQRRHHLVFDPRETKRIP